MSKRTRTVVRNDEDSPFLIVAGKGGSAFGGPGTFPVSVQFHPEHFTVRGGNEEQRRQDGFDLLTDGFVMSVTDSKRVRKALKNAERAARG